MMPHTDKSVSGLYSNGRV